MKIKWGISRGFELFLIGLMLFCLMALFQETSIFREKGLEWFPHLVSGVQFSGVVTFWVTIILYHVALFIILSRSVVDFGRKANNTSNWLDYTAGFIAVLGIYLVAMSTIYVLYKGPTTNIEFLFNISSIALLRIGFVMEFIAVGWFAATE